MRRRGDEYSRQKEQPVPRLKAAGSLAFFWVKEGPVVGVGTGRVIRDELRR